jgi:anti-anti-sigma regulatory factor
MLRITIHDAQRGKTIQLEGKIVGPWVEELRRVWCSLAPSFDSKELLLDLRGVAFIDAQGRQLLRQIFQRTSTRFVADSPLTQYFAEEAMRPAPRNGTEGE